MLGQRPRKLAGNSLGCTFLPRQRLAPYSGVTLLFFPGLTGGTRRGPLEPVHELALPLRGACRLLFYVIRGIVYRTDVGKIGALLRIGVRKNLQAGAWLLLAGVGLLLAGA